MSETNVENLIGCNTQPSAEEKTQTPSLVMVLPAGLQFYARQAGGHHHARGTGRLGLIYDPETKRVLKHMPPGHAEQEIVFYEWWMKEIQRNKETVRLPFIARYHGVKTLNICGHVGRFLELDDLMNGDLKGPNTLDAKLDGTYKLNVSPDRIKLRQSKYPLNDELGFRLDGYTIYNKSAGEYLSVRDRALLNKSRRNILHAIQEFLTVDHERVNSKMVVAALEPKLVEFEQWLESQKDWKFFCASVILAFEIDANSDTIECRLAFVDFVHAQQSDKIDEVCLRGFRNLRSFLKEAGEKREE